MKKIDKEFISFLKRNDCYYEYKENFINNGYYPKFREFMHFAPRKKYISYAFFWKNTPQGYEYWNVIYRKWIDYLDSIKKQNNETED